MKLRCNCCDGIYDSLDVRFTKACDNACAFCIDRICEFESQGDAPVDVLIEKTIETGISSVLILGGEPFLNIKKLLAYVDGIRPHLKEIYITTSMPKTIHENPEITGKILDLIDGLNVSFQHYDSDINNDIMNASSRHDRLETLRLLLNMDKNKVRVAINLTKGGVCTKEMLDTFIDRVRYLGARKVKVNELCHSEENFISFESMSGIKMKSPYANGCQTEMAYRGVAVTLKRSCFVTDNSLGASFADLTKAVMRKVFKPKTNGRFMVLYEDGSVYNQWKKG